MWQSALKSRFKNRRKKKTHTHTHTRSHLLNMDIQKENFVFLPYFFLKRKNSEEKLVSFPPEVLYPRKKKKKKHHPWKRAWRDSTLESSHTNETHHVSLGIWPQLLDGPSLWHHLALEWRFLGEAHSGKEHSPCITTDRCQLNFPTKITIRTHIHTFSGINGKCIPSVTWGKSGNPLETDEFVRQTKRRSYDSNISFHMHCCLSCFYMRKKKGKIYIKTSFLTFFSVWMFSLGLVDSEIKHFLFFCSYRRMVILSHATWKFLAFCIISYNYLNNSLPVLWTEFW